MTEFTFKATRNDDDTYSWKCDADGWASGGNARNARGLVEDFENIVAIVEDRASGGSGLL